MKKRTAGGFAVVILALGFMLGQLFDLGTFGLGKTGDGEQVDATTDSDDSPIQADLSDVSAGGDLNSTTTVTPNQEGGEKDVVTIVIHNDLYRMTSADDPLSGLDLPLSEVVRQVSKATGGAQGVKLKILFEKNAQEGALADLHAALLEEGIKREEIQEISGYVE